MTINLGIIGFGYCGRQQLQAAASVPGLRVVAVADREPGALPGDVVFYREWARLLADPRVDAVSICLPHFLHNEVTLAAIEAGKPVLLEKPLAPRLSEAEEIAIGRQNDAEGRRFFRDGESGCENRQPRRSDGGSAH